MDGSEFFVWKPIDNFEDLYVISSTGRVRRIGPYGRGQDLKIQVGKRGYPTVGLLRSQKQSAKTIHRLLAKAFIPNPENKREVNHKNGIKTDNRLENLEWTTPKENSQHAVKMHRTKSYKRGAYPFRSNGQLRWQAQIKINRKSKSLGLYDTKDEAHEAYRIKYLEIYGAEPWA